MDATEMTSVMRFCGNCSCGCPELFVDAAAPAERRMVLTDDFGQQVRMSAGQLRDLMDAISSGALSTALDAAGI